MPSLRDSLISTALVLTAATAQAAPASGPVLDWASLPLPSIDGGTLAPDAFRGKAVLVVNTASQCGFTGQYDGLQKLWAENRDRGLVVLGVPSNDFGAQEPGNNAQVASFCQLNYGVDFPLMEKQAVTGPDAHPFYRWAAQATEGKGLPRWNFHKILVGRDGRLAAWFPSAVAPESSALKASIDEALAKPSATVAGP